MLKNHLIKKFSEALGYNPTNDQTLLFNTFANYVTEGDSEKVLLIKGYAGTGKTSATSAIVNVISELKINYVLLAPTGRAAKVFSSFTNKKAYTIHKKIYRQVSSKDAFGKFVLDYNKHKNTLFFIDEASMINSNDNESSVFGSGRLINDLFTYLEQGKNCSLVLIGDSAQLPPVGHSYSPALDLEFIKSFGKKCLEIELKEVVRQELDSGIYFNATKIRNNISRYSDEINNEVEKIDIEYNDINSVSGNDIIELISESYYKEGIENTIIITRSNKMANIYNQGIRNRVLFYDSEILSGDYLMIVKNNYYWTEKYKLESAGINFIANGDIAKIKKIKKIEELYGFRFADIVIELIDYDNIEIDIKIILDSLHSESAALTYEDNKKLFYTILEDYQGIKSKKEQYNKVKENEYFNALQVKFSYAITCHKSQGGQWGTIFIDHGFVKPENFDVEFYRWLYTAFTRAKSKLYLINFNKSLIK